MLGRAGKGVVVEVRRPITDDPATGVAGGRSGFAVIVDRTLEGILAVALLGELFVIFCNILTRSIFRSSFEWANEPAEMALSCIAFLGGAYAYRRGEHAFIRAVLDVLPPKAQRASYILADLCVLMVAVAIGLGAVPLFLSQREELSSILLISTSWFVLPIIAGAIVLAGSATERLIAQHRPTLLVLGGCGAVLGIGGGLTLPIWRPWLVGSPSLWLAIAFFFGPVLLGVPVAFALILGTLSYLLASGALPIMLLAHTMVHGVNNFVLLALPFFIFAAVIMNQGGISLRLVRLMQAFIGHVRSGLLQVMVVSMYIVSGLSGSKAADVGAVGSVMRDMLRKEGYSLEQSAAVLASSAVMGETVPPSIAMLVLCSVTTVSVGALFIAGLLPAAVIGLCLMGLIYVQARRSNAGRLPRATLSQLRTAALQGVLPLLMPLILFGGILFGIATPTEVSSFAVVYGLALAGLVYQELGLRAFLQSVVECSAMSGMILFIIAAASSFSRVLTVAHLPQRLVTLLSGVQHTQWLFLLASMLLLIVAGSILEGLPALLILAPILLPIAGQVGVSLLHYSIVLVIAMGIGAFMPPVGAGFYIACAVCDASIERSSREMIPYITVLCLGLVVVALAPWFTLFLPQLFGIAGR
jgi:tripartite ATP-independent transporter DctM subunit